MNPRMRLAASAAVTATIAGLLGASAAPAGAATCATAQLRDGILTVTGTAARDVLGISMGHRQVAVDFGFDGTVDARFLMSGVRRLSVQLGDGNDGLSVIGAGVGDVPVTIGGGLSNGPERISLGGGNDKFVSTLDVFVSPFTARNDVVDGGTGKDTLELRGTFESESLSLSAEAGHLIALHDARDRTDSVHVENVTWFGFGGNDESGFGDDITVNDLSGTGVVNFTPDFSSPSDATAPNNSADQLRVVATPGDDHITVNSSGASIIVSGLTPAITPVLLDANDVLRIDTLAGHDTVDTAGLPPGLVQLQVF